MSRASSPASRGLAAILLATAIAGVSGYAIQLLAAPALPEAGRYLAFTSFWSTLFLFGGAIGGVQQEMARATTPRVDAGHAFGARPFVVRSLVVVVIGGAVAGMALAPTAFGDAPVASTLAFVVGLVGYLLTSMLTGLFYGLAQLSSVAALITVDAVLRGVAVVSGLLLGASQAVLAFAVALPFGLAVALVWIVVRRRVVGAYTLDVDTARLSWNALRTVGAAMAVGLLVTGMPLLFRVFLTDSPEVVVASLTFVVMATRAPLIIPVMALQSYLVVSFRTAGSGPGAGARMARFLAIGTAVAAVCAGAAWFVGPWAIEFVSGGRYGVDASTSMMVIVSAATAGLMFVTGPALLAADRHNLYVAGWAVAAVVTVALLMFVPLPATPRALIALCVAPVCGLAVHLWAFLRVSRSAIVDE